MEVYTSRSMVLRRGVRIGGMVIYGKDVSGIAIIHDRKDPLQLHCRTKATKLQRAPWFHVCETISNVFKIPSEHRETLALVLVTPAGPLVQDILSCKGLWDEDISDTEDFDEEDEPELETEIETAQHGAHIDADARNEMFMSEGDAASDGEPAVYPDFGEVPEFADAATPVEDGELLDDPEFVQPSSARPQPNLPRQTRSGGNVGHGGPSLSATRALRKAQREEAAIDAIQTAAINCDVEIVQVHGPLRPSANHPRPFTGLAFHDTEPEQGFADQQDGLRYWGELFAREVLSTHFECDDKAWTSDMRTRQNLEELEDLGDCSTFTVDNQTAVTAITNWLVRQGCDPTEPESEFLETAITYHIYVKATDGGFDEPFTISNQEFELVCSTC